MNHKFSERSSTPEIMDDLQCAGEVVNQTLVELEIINRWLGGNAVTVNGVSKLVRASHGKKNLSIADVGCGGGDVLKEIAEWGQQKELTLHLTGIDANPNIIEFAKANTRSYPEIDYIVKNIFSVEFSKNRYDIIVATLFTHHFSNSELSDLLNSLTKQSNIGVVINDLHRHWFAYHSIRWLTRLFSKSSMVKYDAPLSVLRAFKRKDLLNILQQAGISEFSLKWKWAFRWQLVIPSSLA